METPMLLTGYSTKPFTTQTTVSPFELYIHSVVHLNQCIITPWLLPQLPLLSPSITLWLFYNQFIRWDEPPRIKYALYFHPSPRLSVCISLMDTTPEWLQCLPLGPCNATAGCTSGSHDIWDGHILTYDYCSWTHVQQQIYIGYPRINILTLLSQFRYVPTTNHLLKHGSSTILSSRLTWICKTQAGENHKKRIYFSN